MKIIFKISSQKNVSIVLFGVVLISIFAVFAVLSGLDNSLVGKFLGARQAKAIIGLA